MHATFCDVATSGMAEDTRTPTRVQGNHGDLEEGPDITPRSSRRKRGRDDLLSPGTADLNGRAAKHSCWEGVGKFFTRCIDSAVTSRSSSLPPTTVKNGNEEIRDQLSLPSSRRRYTDHKEGDEGSGTRQDCEEPHKYSSNSTKPAALALNDRTSNGCSRSCAQLLGPHSEERQDTRALVPYDGPHVEAKSKPTNSTTTSGLGDNNVGAADDSLERTNKRNETGLIKGTNTDIHKTGNDRSQSIIGGENQRNDERERSWTGLCQCGRYLFVMGGKSWTGTCHCGRTLRLLEASTAITTRERWTCQACHAWNSDMDAHECDMCCQGRDVDVKPPVKNDSNMRIVKMFPVPLSKAVEQSVPASKPTKRILAAAAEEPGIPTEERTRAVENSSATTSSPKSDDIKKAACGQICTSASVPSVRHADTVATPTTSPIASFTFGPSSSHGAKTDVSPPPLGTTSSTPASDSASFTAGSGGHGVVAAAGSFPQKIVKSSAPDNSVSGSEKLSHRIPEKESSGKNTPEGDVVTIGSTAPVENAAATVAITATKTAPVPAVSACEFAATAATSSARPATTAGPRLLGTGSAIPVAPIAKSTSTVSTFVFGARPSVAPAAPSTAAITDTASVVGSTAAEGVAVSIHPVARGDAPAPSTKPMLSPSKTAGPANSRAAAGVSANLKCKIQISNTLWLGGAGGDGGALSSTSGGNNNPPGTSWQAPGSTSTPNSIRITVPNSSSGDAIGLSGSSMQVSTTPIVDWSTRPDPSLPNTTATPQHAQGNGPFNFFGSVVGRAALPGAPTIHPARTNGVLPGGTAAAPATTLQASGSVGPVQAPIFGAAPTSTANPFSQSSSTFPARAAVSQAPGFSFGGAVAPGLASAPAHAPAPGASLPQGGGSLPGFSVGSTNRQRSGGGKVGRRIVRARRPKQ